jgi:hypothetical protein
MSQAVAEELRIRGLPGSASRAEHTQELSAFRLEGVVPSARILQQFVSC